jgi:hypothetical protein
MAGGSRAVSECQGLPLTSEITLGGFGSGNIHAKRAQSQKMKNASKSRSVDPKA